MAKLTLDQANRMAGAALAKGRELSLKPLCVAVLDAGGHLIALQREDGASNLRPQIAMGKASSALGLGVSSRVIGEMAAERPTFIASLAGLADAAIVPAAGGVIIRQGDAVLGAVGVTGDTSDNDEVCAMAGISTAGFAI
ncbi:heme-binding protein [Novosphingobium sp. TH158]|uniref:GlcG/HbpS family heme-binding protein n=1 Tax=Novosphingobium sp. TH158 TaxID=2067455 RepID=UPI000C7A9640|nr:heme-binding protein [Novosphingobium sp. TH158]PLK26747.1 GlcG protein [Novosphingobium sp. TH158]